MLVEKTNNLHFRADKINNGCRKKQINLRAAKMQPIQLGQPCNQDSEIEVE
jgi:hypothetical protein